VPGVGVVVNSAAAAREVLSDGDRFVKNGPGSSGALWTPVLGPSVLLNMEGPEHRSLRARLAGLFTPASAEALCGRVLPPIIARLDQALRSGEAVDLVPVVQEAAGAVIGELIGFPSGDYLELFARGEEIVSMVGLRTRELSAAQVARARQVLDDVVAPAAAAYRRGDPATAMGRMAGEGLSEAEALGAAAAFFLTGTETVATTVPRLIAMFCDHGIVTLFGADSGSGSDAAPDLSPDPDLDRTRLDRAIDEGMRVIAPTPMALRRCIRTSRVAGVTVREGERVLISTLTCTRGAGPFDPGGERPDLRRLWFGAGAHYCIGAPLALAEIRVLARAILACAPLRITRRRPARGVLIPAYRELEVARA
jgi:cytochrome P450